MDNNLPKTLEELIHRELSKLPEHQAPDTLIPRVFARIRARENRRWWQRPWNCWPFAAQLASLPLMLASAGGAVFAVTLFWKLLVARPEFGVLPGKLESFWAVWDVISALGNAVAVLGRAATQEWLLLALFVPLAMYLACVGVGTLCYRMALQKR